MSYIYKITNDVNNKIYVGKTNHLLEKRFAEHLRDAKKQKCKNRPLYNAINKYGEGHFHIELIEKVDDKIACEREQYWINELRTYIYFEDCNGYNATYGGDGTKYKKYNVEDFIKMYNETHDVMLISKTYNIDDSYIRKLLKENNVEMWSSKDVFIEKHSKKIYQVELNTFNVLNIFKCSSEANLYMHKNKDNGTIYDACNARRGHHHAYGYDWYFEKDYLKLKDKQFNDNNSEENTN